MSILKAVVGIGKTVANTFTGGLAGEIIDAVAGELGPDITPEQQAKLKMTIENNLLKREQLAMQAANDAERNLTDRVAQLEGTASDLKSVPFLGPLMLFIRGLIRPLATIMVCVIDWQVFSGSWQPVVTYDTGAGVETIDMMNLLFLLNGLVLSFWFGERAIKNVMPFVTQMMAQRSK